MSRKTYTGKDVNVSFDSELCIHAAECVKGLPAVFDVNKRPWISPDGATKEEVIEVVKRCPSGALEYHEQNGEISLNKIKFLDNSYYIGEEDNRIAEITFVPTGKDKIIIDHTFVSEDLRGEGIGQLLVDKVVEYARENNKRIIPLCPFAKEIMEKSPAYNDILN